MINRRHHGPALIKNLTMHALQVPKSQPITFYVDMPTSKTKVLMSSFQKIATLTDKMKHKKFCIYCPCAARQDLLHAMKNACKVQYGSEVRAMTVTLHAGDKQSIRTVPTYALVMVSTDHPLKTVPSHTEVNRCRACVWEALRLRCVDACCPHIPKLAAGAHTVEPTTFEDDGEPEADGDTLAIEEDNASGAQDEADLLDVGDILKKTKMEAKDVFCFTKPLDYYGKTFATVLGLSSGKVAIITKSAHPGLPVAARLAGLEVLLCVEDVTPHSKGHGDELLLSFFKQLKMADARKATKPLDVKSVGNSDLTFMSVLAPAEKTQIVQARSPPARNVSMFI